MSGFKTAQRFETEVAERKLRPAYVLIGDEAFFRKRCREAILKYLAPPEVRDFSLYEMDLLETDVSELLDRARTPSLMAPFQVFFVRGVEALGSDMMLVANELEKLVLYVGDKKRITLGDVETMVLAAKQRSLYELTDAISAKDRARALEMMDAMLNSGDGDEAAIGHLYMLAKTFRQMLVILEKNVSDS